jgi:anti-anti-sigma factor
MTPARWRSGRSPEGGLATLPAFKLDITHGEEGSAGTTQIAVTGELDGASAPTLLEAFHELVSSGEARRLTLDLGHLEFIDSAGLRALIELEHGAERREIALVVVPAPEEVTHLLQLAGVAQRLRLVDDGPSGPAAWDFLERTDTEYTPDPLAPSRARSTVRELLGGALEQSVLSSVVLMTSELVTNAVRHSSASEPSSSVGLRVVTYPDVIRVEVDDPGPGFDPSTQALEPLRVPGPDQGGRGLFVVDRSAQRWGTRRLDNDRGRRFAVWFEIEPA